MANPPIHLLNFGESGAGKSTGARTFPTPLCVFFWDPFGMEHPYLYDLVGQPYGVTAPSVDAHGTPIQESYASDGTLLVRIEHYIDRDPQQPTGYGRFLRRMADFDPTPWATVVNDSVTYMELMARKEQQYVLNPMARDPRQWWGGSTDALEEVLMLRFGAMPCNVVVNAHVDEDKDELHGNMIRNPAAPGRLRKRSPSGYGEMYHSFVKRDEAGKPMYLWQTRSDHQFNAKSLVGAPDPCPQHYLAIWAR